MICWSDTEHAPDIVVVARRTNGTGLSRFLSRRRWFSEYPEAQRFQSRHAARHAVETALAVDEEHADSAFEFQIVSDYGLTSERVLETVRKR